MPPTNRLPELLALLPSGSTQTQYPPSRSGTPSGPLGQPPKEDLGSFGRRRRRKRLTEEEKREREEEREFLKEGYSIHTHLTSLSTHLQSIRRAYLSTQPVPISRAPTPRPTSSTSTSTPEDPEQKRLKALERAKVLTEREREEVDLRARVVLGGCKERVGVLEVREKIRQNRTKPSATGSLLSTLLPSLTNTQEQGITPQQRSTILTAHHASILWSLNNCLLKLSDTIREMQEERAKIRSERGKSLGGLVTADRDGPGGAGGLIRRLGAGKRVGVDRKPITLTIPTMPLPEGSMKDQPNDSTLTQEQIQQFSSENDTLLENMNTTLNTVLRAEKSLLEISQLQSSLIAHLATQTESIELLYDEAIETVADLDRANTQLKRARERGKEGRLYLVVFLVIASLALLFLDFYS